MQNPPNPVVRVTRHFPFPAERVFDAWLDPKLAAKWLFATPTGRMVRAEIDPRVGGRYTFVERRDGEDVEHTGEYLEINRPRRLVFTFGVPKYSPDFDRVTVEITPEGDGCLLTLTNEMKPEWAEWSDRTRSGWTDILQGLAASLGDERAKTNHAFGRISGDGEVRFVRLLPGPIERVWSYLTDPEKRVKWFAGGPMELRVGGRVELLFRHSNLAPHEQPPEKYREYHDPGDRMIGTVTRCEPPRVLSYTWFCETPGEGAEVTFELTPHGNDVQLVLTHRRLGRDRERLASVGAGWHTHFALLFAQLAGTEAPPFWATHGRLEPEYGKLADQANATNAAPAR